MSLKRSIAQAKKAVADHSHITLCGVSATGAAAWTFNTLHTAQASAVAAGIDLMPPLAVGMTAWLLGAACGYSTHLFYTGIAARLHPLLKEKDRSRVQYELPPYPDTKNKLRFVLGEYHADESGKNLPIGQYSDRPEWYEIPAVGLYTGVAILGATGSAKTAGVIRPALAQLLTYGETDDHKPGGLIMDYKASLVAPAIEAALAAGREDDLMIIGPNHPYKWNPLHAPHLEAKVIAGRLLAVLENLSGQSNKGDTSWIADGAGGIIEHAVGIIRLGEGYITIARLHEFATSLDRVVSSNPEDPTGAVSVYLDALTADFVGANDLENEQMAYHKSHFTTTYASSDKRFRGIFLSELTRITNYFAQPKYRPIYSPAIEDINFNGFDDAIRNGKIVVLDANADIYGDMANALGIFLKLDYQRAMLSRPVRTREDETYNNKRPMLLIIDEVQEFASTGDANFLALSRESKAIVMFATQSRHSLVGRLGEERSNVLLASMRTRIWLALSDADDCEKAAQHCGQEWNEVKQTNISESVQGAGMAQGGTLIGDASTVSQSQSFSSQKINLIEPVEFSRLPVFTAIVSVFDGIETKPPARVLLKPYFKPNALPFAEFMAELKEKR